MSVDVWWLTLRDDVPARGMWDQAIVEWLVGGLPWTVRHTERQPDGGAVVVVHGGGHADLVDDVNAAIAPLPWCVLIVTSDEGSHFPHSSVDHPNVILWVQNPRSDRHGPSVRPLPVGWTPQAAVYDTQDPPDKPLDWSFAGQVTHRRRRQAVRQMETMDRGRLHQSEGFTLGLPPDEYLAWLAASKVAPCPAGIVTPDSFRVWEALQAGAIPMADTEAGEWDVPGDYWQTVCGDRPPFPTVRHWSNLGRRVGRLVAGWPGTAVDVQTWWLRFKRDLVGRLAADVAAAGGLVRVQPAMTVLMPTSPIPSHPDTGIIEQTVKSVRDRTDAPIVVMADGVRPEQSHREPDYREYLRRLLWLAHHRWDDVAVIVADRHLHQSGLTRHALQQVDSPTVMFVEHDTPLAGDIDLDGIIYALTTDRLDLVRLHHESRILEPHRHLMVDQEPVDMGVPVLRTVQWSQRPHVASTGYYRRILADHFRPDERWMIEDRMHSVVQCAWDDDRLDGWQRHRLAVYTPDGNMQRSTHLDGRGDDPKWTDR